MPSLRARLISSLKGWERIAVLGIGSELRGDDAAGLKVLEKLGIATGPRDDVALFHGGSAPENLTGAIRAFNPTHLIVIDAADLGKKPGFARILTGGEIEGTTFSTHSLPISIILRYLRSTVNAKEIVIGIQPQCLEFDSPVTDCIAGTIESLSHDIASAIEKTRTR